MQYILFLLFGLQKLTSTDVIFHANYGIISCQLFSDYDMSRHHLLWIDNMLLDK